MSWASRHELPNLRYPGVYALANSSSNLSGQSFGWSKKIVYFGMSNSALGLKGRLKQFDNTVLGKTGHGGAERFRFKHPIYETLVRELYVAVAPFKCNPTSCDPGDLKIMGEVASFEYHCFAYFVELYGQLPDFNNKKESPKHSKAFRDE